MEEIEGDMEERFYDNIERYDVKRARQLYVRDTFKLLRPALMKSMGGDIQLDHYDMFKNYFKVGTRNILKYKAFSFINIFGLSISMSVSMLIISLLVDQKSYDRSHNDKDRIYRIISDENGSKAPNALTAFPLALTLKTDYPIIEKSTHLIRGISVNAVRGQQDVDMNGYFADTSFFDMFDHGLSSGDRATALSSPNSLVMTSELGHRLFGDEDPIGKTVDLFDRGQADSTANWGAFTVTGIFADKREKSHLKFDVLVSTASLPILSRAGKINDFTDSWQAEQSYTYVLLGPSKGQEDLASALDDLLPHRYKGPDVPKGFMLIGQRLNDITPGIIVRNPPSDSLPMMAYYFLASLAAVIMVSACLNYINLSIARSLNRAKEIGVRKVTGAFKRDLILQFLTESVINASLALIGALFLLILIVPAVKRFNISQVFGIDFSKDIPVYFFFTGFALFVGIIAGIFPAMHLASYRPIKALKKLQYTKTRKSGIQKTLSVSQFVISLFFIVTSILIYDQLVHFLGFRYGFTAENIVNIDLKGNDHRLVSNELGTVAGVTAISACNYLPATNVQNGIFLKDLESGGEYIKTTILLGDENFIDVLGIDLLVGKGLSATNDSSDRSILVNEAAVRAFGYSNPDEMIGQVFESKDANELLEVAGVVKDFVFKAPFGGTDKIGPLILRNVPYGFNYINIKIASGDVLGTIAQLEEKWKDIDPIQSFDHQFFDEQLKARNRPLYDVISIIGYITFIAVSIACLGMLGMATYAAERRKKEVGIRKVLGADDLNVAFLLSRAFLNILLVSMAIGVPLSFFLNNLWLQNFPNRVTFGFGTISLGTGILLILGLIMIGSQTISASRRDPLDSLKNE